MKRRSAIERPQAGAAKAPAAAPQSAFLGAQYLMGLQIFVRLVTFSMNTLVIYVAGRQAFGVASIQFELLLSTILFLSREGMRNALLRVNVAGGSAARSAARGRPSGQEQRIINAALVPIVAGMAMAGCLYWFYAGDSAVIPDSAASIAPRYRQSLTVYIAAAWVELWAEPLFVLSRARVLFKLQAKCEGIAVTCRCTVVVATLLLGRYVSCNGSDGNPLRLLAFAAGQMAYAVAIVAMYAWHMSQVLDYPVWMCYVPRKLACGDGDANGGYIGSTIGGLAVTFVGQSLLKHLLTQGDSMVMARFATADEMGSFAFVSNYGSIPARVIFLPLEEASRAVFSKTAAAVASSQDSDKRMSADGGVWAEVRYASHVLSTLGKLQVLFGMILAVFGTLYSPVLASLARQGDTAVGQALAAYCLYLPLMGLNGFLEAFVHSVASKSQLLRSNVWMVGFTAVYMLAAVQALWRFGAGSAGIIVANMLNMALRIFYCKTFVSSWFARLDIAGPRVAALLPHSAVIVTCLGSAAVIVAASAVLDHLRDSITFQLSMLMLGGVLGVVVLGSIWLYEQPLVRSVRGLRAGKLQHLKAC